MYSLIQTPISNYRVGSQKCYLNSQLITSLNLQPGTYIFIKSSCNVYICSLWASSDCNSDYIQIDPTISKNNAILDTYATIYKECDYEFSSISQVSNITQLDISVVVSNSKLTAKFKDTLKNNSCDFNCLIKNLLKKLCFSSGYTVNVFKTKLGKLYGIESIIIEKICCDNDVGKFTDETMISTSEIISRDRYIQRFLRNNTSSKILLKEYTVLMSDMNFIFNCNKMKNISNNHAILLIGSRGCGKKHLVQSICNDMDVYLCEVSGSQLFKSLPGESEENLRDIFDKMFSLSNEGSCVLFVSEIEILCPCNPKGNLEKRLIAQFISLLDELVLHSNLIVIGATYQVSNVHSSIRRHGRFGKELFLKMPSILERLDIIETLTCDLTLSPDTDLHSIAEACPGFVISDIKNLIHQAVLNDKINLMGNAHYDVSMKSFKEALKITHPCNQDKFNLCKEFRPLNWDDICGLHDVKNQMIQAIEWPLKYFESFIRLGITPPRGVLLYGPPGCAKTSLVCAAATSCHVNFFSINGAQLYSSFVGDSERKLRDIFSQARTLSPAILFLDELDSLVGKRQNNENGKNVSDRILSTLLNEMDGVGIDPSFVSTSESDGKVLIVAATNRIDLIDDALLRPGRLDRIIQIALPDEETRKEILKSCTRNIDIIDKDIDFVADATQNYSGADVENLCREAILEAINENGLNVSKLELKQFQKILAK